jgi:ribose/xylose/arabinose/galactoside ABC-type transport system permease subunit
MTAGATRIRTLLRSEYLVLVFCVLLFGGLAPFTEGLASPGNMGNITTALLPLLVVATGQTIVLIAGGIDLSVTSTIALSSVAGAMVMNDSTGVLKGHPAATAVGIAVMLGIGAAVGLFNGLSIARLRMPAFMVTLTSMMFVSGFAVWLSKSNPISGLPAGFTAPGQKFWLAVLISAALAIAAHVMLTRSVYGRWLHAVGHNARAARVSGVPVDRVLIGAYVVCGVFAAAAGILYTAKLETGSPVMGQRVLLDVIAATVIGGTSLFGGRGKVVWTLFGALFLTVLDNALNLLGMSHYSIAMVKGGVILLAALLDALRTTDTQR